MEQKKIKLKFIFVIFYTHTHTPNNQTSSSTSKSQSIHTKITIRNGELNQKKKATLLELPNFGCYIRWGASTVLILVRGI